MPVMVEGTSRYFRQHVSSSAEGDPLLEQIFPPIDDDREKVLENSKASTVLKLPELVRVDRMCTYELGPDKITGTEVYERIPVEKWLWITSSYGYGRIESWELLEDACKLITHLETEFGCEALTVVLTNGITGKLTEPLAPAG